jgi:hypothetical protein
MASLEAKRIQAEAEKQKKYAVDANPREENIDTRYILSRIEIQEILSSEWEQPGMLEPDTASSVHTREGRDDRRRLIGAASPSPARKSPVGDGRAFRFEIAHARRSGPDIILLVGSALSVIAVLGAWRDRRRHGCTSWTQGEPHVHHPPRMRPNSLSRGTDHDPPDSSPPPGDLAPPRAQLGRWPSSGSIISTSLPLASRGRLVRQRSGSLQRASGF